MPAPAGAGPRRRRPLRPGSLHALASGLWAVDAFQPAAAVLDPGSGEVRQLVSWSELPPPAPGEPWPPPRRIDDGRSLWVQEHADGPLARVGVGGIETSVWTGGLPLRACGDEVAWCASLPPEQELVAGPRGRPVHDLGRAQLLRVSAQGRCSRILAQEPVRSVTAGPGGVWVEMLVHPWTLGHLGAGMYEVVWDTRWLWLAADEEPPGVLPSAARDGAVDGPPDQWTGSDEPSSRGWDLGPGTVVAVTRVGERWAVAVASERRAGYQRLAPVEVLGVEPASGAMVPLLAPEAVDVSRACWPLTARPVEAGSYEQQVGAAYQQPAPSSENRSSPAPGLTGDWPDTCLEWRLESPLRPGLTLRRRVPLYDELGRISAPEYAAVHVDEDLAMGAVPPAAHAVDGVLDF